MKFPYFDDLAIARITQFPKTFFSISFQLLTIVCLILFRAGVDGARIGGKVEKKDSNILYPFFSFICVKIVVAAQDAHHNWLAIIACGAYVLILGALIVTYILGEGAHIKLVRFDTQSTKSFKRVLVEK